MARIKMSSLVSDIRGKIGEVVYSVWKSGVSYVRQTAKVVSNPQSSAQAKIRARITECAKYWKDTLTQAQRNAWEAYAPTLPKYLTGPGDIIKKSAGIMSGFNAFVRNNLNSFTAGISALGTFIADAPIGVTAPDAVASIAAGWDGSANEIDVTWVAGTVPGLNVRIWLRSTDANIHAQVNQTEAVATLAKSCSQVAAAKGLMFPIDNAPGLYDVQIDVVDANGQDSPASALVRNIVVS